MDFQERYRIISARDSRFDGQFVVAVHTTGIYCRPSCPARTPKPSNVSFYATSAAAHEAGYRACKRCLPEAVPGSPQWNLGTDVAARAMRLIADGVVERDGVGALAAKLGYSARQLNRILTDQLGAGPLALARAQRAQTARILLTETTLPLSDVAFAAGFGSIRQFNDTIATVYQLTPRQLRAHGRVAADTSAGAISLRLPLRPPADLAGVFGWLAARAIAGVEDAGTDHYARVLHLPGGTAWFEARPLPDLPALEVRARLTRLSDLPTLISRVRRLFDLDADPNAIDQALSRHPELAASVHRTPGIRMPGAVDGPEMVTRAIVGQQISVASARTQLTRLAEAAGTPVTIAGRDWRCFPDPAQIVDHAPQVMRGPSARTAALTQTAQAMADGELAVTYGEDWRELHDALVARRGIGEWTAGYVSMRVLGCPDVFLPGDVALRTGAAALGLSRSKADLSAFAARYAPWRSYLCLHLWRAA